MEPLRNLFTIDEPIGRANFAGKTFGFLFFCAIFLAFLNDIEPKLHGSVSRLILVGLLVLLFIVFAIFYTVTIIKRYWDIVSDKKNAIIWGLCTLYIAPLVPIIGGIACTIAIITLFFMRGQEV
jgi:hypothetical protein